MLGGEGAALVGVNAVFTGSSIVGGAGNDTFNASSSTAASTFFFGFGSGVDTLTTGRTGKSASSNTFAGTIAVSATYGGTGSVSGRRYHLRYRQHAYSRWCCYQCQLVSPPSLS